MRNSRNDRTGRSARRRQLTVTLLRAVGLAVLLLVVYYAAPLDRPLDAESWIVFVAGLAVYAGLVAWEVRAIAASDIPRLRAVQAVAVTLPALLLFFAAAYVLLASNDPDSFTQPLSRTDALYFTVTVFATVGFGDIAPRTELARIVTMLQMLLDLVVVGVVARILLGAVQVAVRRREGEGPAAGDTRDRTDGG